MKQQLILVLTVAFASAMVPSVFAADVPDLSTSGLVAERTETTDLHKSAAQARSYNAWKISLGAVAGSEVLDAISSRGLHEANPLLAGSNGQFGTKATILKVGIAGALIGVEYLVVRNHPGAAKIFWKLNLISAGVTGATAAHNYSLH